MRRECAVQAEVGIDRCRFWIDLGRFHGFGASTAGGEASDRPTVLVQPKRGRSGDQRRDGWELC